MFLAVLYIALTIVVYAAMRQLYKKYPLPFLVPIATCTFIIILLLLGSGTDYAEYMKGGIWIDGLLGPAVVALAYPLYESRRILKKYALTILASVFPGSIIGIGSGTLLAGLFHVDEELILSLAPKSVTNPIAMDIADMMGGIPALAAIYVVIAGVSGAMFGPSLLQLFGIHHSVAKGIGLGAASHGTGTARALELGELEGAISSISMTLCAIFTAIICPLLAPFILNML
ncbi:LrgB family protein [Metabacillus idriensis]|uniref:LrgB family protein n=1 Tax=Metabacillus idriensis TaxID=324768 RepID=UPI00174D24A9|nr:LrgB family protein [Metabacillus idriensis]